MADVVIKIDIDAKTAGIDRVREKLALLVAEAEAVDGHFNDMSGSSNRLDRDFKKLDREVKTKDKDFGRLGGTVDKNEKSFKKLGKETNLTSKTFKKMGEKLGTVLKFLGKAALIHTGALAASLALINISFKVGAWLAKGYHAAVGGALKALTALGATALTVLSAFLAGQKQFLAAQNASLYGGGIRGMELASSAMRALTSNTQLAVLGTEALQGAFAAVSKSTPVTGNLVSALTAMGDFAAGAADPKKAFIAAGEFLGQLKKAGTINADAMKAAADVGPQFVKAVEDAKKKGLVSSGSFISALIGGDLSGNMTGQLDLVSGTMFGTFKKNIGILKSMLIDFGQPMLRPLTAAAQRVSEIFQRTFISISGSVRGFANGTLVDSIVNVADKIGHFVTKTFNEYLPQTVGFIGRVKDFFSMIGDGFSKFREWLRPLKEGGQVVIDMFKPALKSIFGGFGESLKNFSDFLVKNKKEAQAFGKALANLFEGVQSIFRALRETFIKALPVITSLVNALSGVLKLLASVISGVASIGGVFGKGGEAGTSFLTLLAAGFGISQLSEKKREANKQKIKEKVAASAASHGSSKSKFGSGTTPAGAPDVALKARGTSQWKETRAERMEMAKRIAGTMALTYGIGTLANAETARKGAVGGGFSGLGTALMFGAKSTGIVGGLLVGAAAGAIVGHFKQVAKNKADVKAAAKKFADELKNAAVEGFASGTSRYAEKAIRESKAKYEKMKKIISKYDLEGSGADTFVQVTKMLKEGLITEEEAKQLKKAPQTYRNTLKKEAAALEKELQPKIDEFNKVVKTLSITTGKTEGEVRKLVDSMDIELINSMDGIRSAIEQITGLDLPSTFKETQIQLRDALSQAITDAFDKPLEIKQAEEAVRESGRNLVNSLAEGVMPDKYAINEYLKTFMEYQMAQGIAPIDAIKNLQALFMPGGAMYKAGAQFAGYGDILGPMMKGAMGTFLTNLAASPALQGITEEARLELQQMGYDTKNFNPITGITDALARGDVQQGATLMLRFLSFFTDLQTPPVTYTELPRGNPGNMRADTATPAYLRSLGPTGTGSTVVYDTSTTTMTFQINGAQPTEDIAKDIWNKIKLFDRTDRERGKP